MPFTFEHLDVYYRAASFADSVAELTPHFPGGNGLLVDQPNRAALSIATNLAEGNGRFTKADCRNFFTIARGSAQKCVPLLEVACRRGLVEPSRNQPFREELAIIAKLLAGPINGLEQREV